MNEIRPTMEDLNAYVDGELGADAAALIARYIARDSFLAKEVACLTKLNATMPKIIPLGPKMVRELQPARTWIYPIAACIAVFVVIASVLASIYVYNQSLAKDWLTVAKSHHESWVSDTKDSIVSNSSVVLAAASEKLGSKVLAPNLSAARLSLARAVVIQFRQEKALHLGYVGTRGCQLSLFVLPVAFTGETKNPRFRAGKDSYRIATWTHANQGFILMASGMDPLRFAMLTKTLANYSGFSEPFNKSTRQQLAKSREESKPCLA